MPVELNLVESVTELDTTVVTVVLESASEPGPAGPGVPTGGTAGQVLTKDSGTDYDTSWQDATGGGGGAPTDATYLVTTANGTLSAEVVVGATPGGELGGTWASPTVDATHSGSSHADVQAAAEATAAAALSAHLTDTSDAHDASAISSVAAGNLAATDVQAALNELDSEKAAATHAHAGEDITSGTVADARIASTIARDSEVTSAIATHEADTTSVHGIADTSALALTADVVTKALYDANTVLKADSDNTPAALTMGASTILARLAAGGIVAATTTEIRTLLGLVIGTNVQAWDADLDTYAGITPSANVQSLLGAANYAAMRALLDLEAGTDFLSVAGVATEIADQKRVMEILVSDPNGSAITTGDGKAYAVVPALLNGHNLVAAHAAVTTVSSSGTPTIQVNNTTQAADMLTTRITIDASEKTSYTAATPPVIDTGNDDVATGDELRIDIDVAGTGAKGLIVILTFEAP